MPLQPRLSLARVARLSLLAAGLGTLLVSLSAQAQVSAAGAVVNAAVLQGAAQNAMAADPAQGAALIAPQGMATPGTTGLPTLPQRPDMGAADAPRTPLTPLRQPKVEAPSQFQRFVQEGTGKLLPLFGANLFDNPQAYSAVSTAAPAPGEYVIGPGDEVRVSISGAVEHSTTQTVDRNGQITLPKVGTVNLGGVQVKDLEATLRKQVGTVFTNVAVNGSLGKLRGVTVYVVGQARQPGTYNLTSLSTLVNAVFASGGPGANGSMRNITLRRGGKTVTTLDLYDFIAKGDKGQDAPLQPGDVIMIPPAGPRVALTGATDHGAIYELKNGTNVQDVLALGGGVPALASAQKALVERIDPQQPRAPRQVQNLVLDAQGLAQALRDGDVITLLPISPAFANAVTLQGTVAQPLRHAFTPGMRVQDLIPDREALITPDYYRRKNQLVQNRTASLKAQGRITLDRSNDFNGTVHVLGGTDVTLRDTDDLTLGAVTATGKLDAKAGGNLLALAVDAARERATLGEISDAMEAVFGRYGTQPTPVKGVYGAAYADDSRYAQVLQGVDAVTTRLGRKPRMLVAKMGQDGHDRGANVIASAFTDMGFDVTSGPLFQTPEETVALALEKDVDAVGASSLAAGHKTLIPQLIGLLKEAGRPDIKVIAGGVIPPQDYDFLREAGVQGIYGPGSNVVECAADMLRLLGHNMPPLEA